MRKMKENIEKVTVGVRYRISGDLQNGSYLTHEDVVRVITRITDNPKTKAFGFSYNGQDAMLWVGQNAELLEKGNVH